MRVVTIMPIYFSHGLKALSCAHNCTSCRPTRPTLMLLSDFGALCTSRLPIIDITPPTTPLRLKFWGSFEKTCLEVEQIFEILLRIIFGLLRPDSIRTSEQTINEKMEKLFAFIARADSDNERQAAEQAILQMILTQAKTVVAECTFTFPDYPRFSSWQKNRILVSCRC